MLDRLADMNITRVSEFYSGGPQAVQAKPMVCVFLRKLNAKTVSSGDFLSIDVDGKQVVGKKVNIVLGMNIYSNKPNCDNLFTEIATRLLVDENIKPTNINCIDIAYQSTHRAYLLEAEIELSRVIAVSESLNYIDQFKLLVGTDR